MNPLKPCIQNLKEKNSFRSFISVFFLNKQTLHVKRLVGSFFRFVSIFKFDRAEMALSFPDS